MSLTAKIVRSLQYASQEVSLRVPAKVKVALAEGEAGAEIAVSLTSYPPRIGMVWKTLETIYRQSVMPSAVVLVLSAEEFPRRELPSSVRKYMEMGLRVIFAEGNTRSYKKLIPVTSVYPNKTIVTADDDVLYPRHWLRDLVAAHRITPTHIIGHRGTVIQRIGEDVRPYVEWPQANKQSPSPRVFLTGMGGILYPPNSLPDTTFDMALAMQLAPTADDIWFKAMSLLAGTPVSKASDGSGDFMTVRSLQKFSLRRTNVDEGRNEVQFKAVMNHFGLWEHLGSGGS